jgi:hypothetical protein
MSAEKMHNMKLKGSGTVFHLRQIETVPVPLDFASP